MARDLARHFGTLENLRSAPREALEEVEGVGPKMSELIHTFLHEDENARAIEALLAKGVELLSPSPRAADALEGKKFVFTGGMSSMTRPEAKKLVEGAGGRAVSSVSSETDYVVAGEGAGSKLTRAKELGIEILDEGKFLELLSILGVPIPAAEGGST